MCAGKAFKINNLGWEDITEYPKLGETEVWEFVNLDSMHTHPMHLHLIEFQVIFPVRYNSTFNFKFFRS